jgi:hypothetical protein
VLDAKGGEIKGQSKWISYHLRNLKIVELEFLVCQNTLIAKFGLLWGELIIMGKGGVLDLVQFHFWNISLYAQTSEFDLEIGK